MKRHYVCCLMFSFHGYTVSCIKHVYVMSIKRDGLIFTIDFSNSQVNGNYISNFSLSYYTLEYSDTKSFHIFWKNPTMPQVSMVCMSGVLPGEDLNMKSDL